MHKWALWIQANEGARRRFMMPIQSPELAIQAAERIGTYWVIPEHYPGRDGYTVCNTYPEGDIKMANKPVVDVNAIVAAVLAAVGQAAPVVAPTKAAKAAPADLSGIAQAMAKGTVEVRQSVKGKPFACVKFEYAGRQQVSNIWL